MNEEGIDKETAKDTTNNHTGAHVRRLPILQRQPLIPVLGLCIRMIKIVVVSLEEEEEVFCYPCL